MEPLDVRDLIGSPGASRRVGLDAEVDGLETELARVRDAVHAELQLESLVEGIFVTGPVSGRMELSCARCLRPLARAFRVDVGELFSPEPDEEEEYRLGEGTLDLEPMLRDAVVLAMPFSPVCRPDCAGLCERCGGDRNRGECSCPPRADPRWGVLSELKLDEWKENSGRTEAEDVAGANPPEARPVEGAAADLQRVPAVPPAQAAARGLSQLRVLRRA